MTVAPSRPSLFVEVPGSDAAVLIGKDVTSSGLGLGFWLPAIWMLLLLFSVVFADILPIRDPTESNFANLKSRPNLTNWLGTDVLARDIFSRVIYGARVSNSWFFLTSIGYDYRSGIRYVSRLFQGHRRNEHCGYDRYYTGLSQHCSCNGNSILCGRRYHKFDYSFNCDIGPGEHSYRSGIDVVLFKTRIRHGSPCSGSFRP